jgi:bifunctional UDP-N-acetylglucosamine pyrophosphorylase / glucosamine-1-phosphate N-acetyltransferase
VSPSRPAAVVVLAAGEGTRMKSRTPKVLHGFLGRSMLGHVLDAVAPLQPERTLVVVGHARDAVTDHLALVSPVAEPVVQEQQDGTGHAVRIALDALPDLEGTLLVVSGDTPLLRTETLHSLVERHRDSQAAATMLTARVADPSGYGRVVRDPSGAVTSVVEHRDADDETLAIDEINSGIYAFTTQLLRDALRRLSRDNSQGEEYLTDVVALLVADGRQVAAEVVDDPREVMGVNDRVQLAAARVEMRTRTNERWMRAGVTVADPATTDIGVDVSLEPDAVVHPWTVLSGATTVAAGAEVGPGSQLHDVQVAEGAVVRFTTAEGAVIGPDASVGPYTYLRPGTRLGRGARAGAFVEAKQAVVGDGSKVPHLSYVGDAEIGEGSNIGAATIFVNYDGVAKHRTVIGDHVRIGSDTMLVAPVTVGDGAYTAAGSVITDDVPPGAMGVGRARQRTILGWVLRKRSGSASARAAEAAVESGTSPTVPADDSAAPSGENERGGTGDPEGSA